MIASIGGSRITEAYQLFFLATLAIAEAVAVVVAQLDAVRIHVMNIVVVVRVHLLHLLVEFFN